MLQKITVMILPVGSGCNLECSYCYHGDRFTKGEKVRIMQPSTLGRIIEGSKDLAVDIDFLWHGGEPLLAGLDMYQNALNIQKANAFKGNIRNILQTNATLINDDWINFFVKNDFLLSISLDGPEYLHDKNRYNHNKQGTFKSVSSGIKKVVDVDKAVGVIAVITKTNVNYPDEVYDALKATGAKTCAFHFCSGDDSDNFSLVPSGKEGISFFKRVFDLWLKDDNPNFLIRNFRNVLRVMYGGRALDCASNHDHCRRFIAVTLNGDVYPCHRFVNKDEFKLGNVLNQSLPSIYEKASKTYDTMASIPEKCFRCCWFKACGGGCAFERFTVGGKFPSEHPECELKQQLFYYIEERVKTIDVSLR